MPDPRRDQTGRFTSPATRRTEPHPARGEVYSESHRRRGGQPQDWPGRLRADVRRDASDQPPLAPPGLAPITPRPPR